MSKLDTLEKMVYMALKTNPRTRDDDRELVLQVYSKYYDVWLGDRFYKIMRNKKLPPFESIRRARQRVQARRPELRSSDDVDAIRKMEELEYKAYAKGE